MRLLVNKHKDPVTGNIVLMSTEYLNETENITYDVIPDPPVIEAREGYTGRYIWNNETNAVDVEYTKNPITTEERIVAMQEAIDALVMGGM